MPQLIQSQGILGVPSSFSCSFPSATQAGNFVVVQMVNAGSDTVDIVNTGFTKISNYNHLTITYFYRANCPSLTTLNFTTTSSQTLIGYAQEFADINLSSITDGVNNVSYTNTTNPSLGTLVTTNNNDLIMSAMASTNTVDFTYAVVTNDFIISSNGFVYSAPTISCVFFYKITNITGTYTGNYSPTSTSVFDVSMQAFKGTLSVILEPISKNNRKQIRPKRGKRGKL